MRNHFSSVVSGHTTSIHDDSDCRHVCDSKPDIAHPCPSTHTTDENQSESKDDEADEREVDEDNQIGQQSVVDGTNH